MIWESLTDSINSETALGSAGAPVFFSQLNSKTMLNLFAKQQPLRILGKNHLSHADEMNEVVQQHFATSITNSKGSCSSSSQIDHWQGVGNSYRAENNIREYLYSKRLSSQIRFVQHRLERLSIAYRTSISFLGGEIPEDDSITYSSGKYSEFIGGEFRSCLNELYGLRDAILIIYFRIINNKSDSYKISKIRNLINDSSLLSSRLIAKSMFEEGKDKIIYRMSLYRNCAMHSTFSAGPFGDLYRICISLGEFGRIPYLLFPLYDNIQELEKIEKGILVDDETSEERDEFIRFMKLDKHVDALEFCYDCFKCLLRICEAMANEVTIAPRPLVLTEKEIISLTLTNGQGETKRYRRNQDTGSLEEY